MTFNSDSAATDPVKRKTKLITTVSTYVIVNPLVTITFFLDSSCKS
jgi:hypothetical protein